MNQSQNQAQKGMRRSNSFREKPKYINLLQSEPSNKIKASNNNLVLSKREQFVGGKLLNDQPNSRRTIDPSLQEKERHRSVIKNISMRSKQSAGVINPNPDNILMYYKDLAKERVKSTTHKSSHQSFRFTDTPTNIAMRRGKKEAPYGKENLMSNILDQTERRKSYIQPDEFYEKARAMKFASDFSSKVFCLPGSYTREIKEDSKPLRKHIVSSYISEKTSLINSHPEREMKWFCASRKITHNILEESKETKDELNMGKRHEHPGIKSQFRSQFELE